MENIKDIRKKSFKIFKFTVFTATAAFLVSNLTALIIITLMKIDCYIVTKYVKYRQMQKYIQNRESSVPSALARDFSFSQENESNESRDRANKQLINSINNINY